MPICSSNDRIKSFIEKKSGLVIELSGTKRYEKVLKKRMSLTSIKDKRQYLDLLTTNQNEFYELIEGIVVPETYFFRNIEPFNYLVKFIRDEWLSHNNYKKINILSVPCSTGEEPYSIVIYLLENKIPDNMFSLDALDISRNSIHSAIRGLYGTNSFRDNMTPLQNKYFIKAGDTFEIVDKIKNKVNFSHGNIIDKKLARFNKKFQVIFCRNLLIYLNIDKKKKLLDYLKDLLDDSGLLFVGHSENILMLTEGFEPVQHNMSFAFRKKKEGLNEKFKTTKLKLVKLTNNIQPVQHAVDESCSEVCKKECDLESVDNLLEAKKLADIGLFEEARLLCEAYLKENIASSDAYYLIGLIDELKGDFSEAEKHYNKALYIDPCHIETLSHYALLLNRLKRLDDEKVIVERIKRIN